LKLKKDEEYFYIKIEEEDDGLNKILKKERKFQSYFAIKLSKLRLYEIAENFDIYGDLDGKNIK